MSSSSIRRVVAVTAAFAALAPLTPTLAQDDAQEQKANEAPFRTRISIGPQFYSRYPGSDDVRLGAFVDVDRARGDDPFEFEAPDESFGVPVLKAGPVELGPVLNWQWKRDADDVGADVPEVDFSLEPGAFVSIGLGENFRLRSEVRKGVTGHKGWIATGGGDFILRDRDEWVFSAGPRVTWSDGKYHNAYFGIAPEDAGPSGLPAYDADSGIQSYGALTSLTVQFSRRWGATAYAQYDRLTGDAADSPLVTELGSRDQFAGGVALSYTFGIRD